MDWTGCLTDDGVATLSCVPVVFQRLINASLVLAGIVALIFIIFAGYKYVTSGGDPKKAEGARKTLTYAIIGLLLILFAIFIVNFIQVITGAPIFGT